MQISPFLKNFRLPFSICHPSILPLVKSFARKQKAYTLPKVTTKLTKAIDRYVKNLNLYGIPPFLHVAKVSPFIQAGVFLRPDAAPLKKGTLIGIYTGELEIVFSTETKNNHYAYDVAAPVTINPQHLSLVRCEGKKPTIKEEYSIQVNAESKGNFTRYINHSSIDTNIDAIAYRLADDTVAICLITKKNIEPGQQLLSNYGGMYWAVLPIIASPVKANDYMLDSRLKVCCLHKSNFHPTKNQQQLLKNLRNAPDLSIDNFDKEVIRKMQNAKIKNAKDTLQKRIEHFEEQILERGILLSFRITKKQERTQIRLSKDSTPIQKSSFIGVLGGKWTLAARASKTMIPSSINIHDKYLSLETKENKNFTNLIEKGPKANVKLFLFKKPKENIYYPILIATKKIPPGHALILNSNLFISP